MTSLAIIGSGILGRSLLYTLAKEQKSVEKITLFHSDIFFNPCSLNSTAIVAPRGVTSGHSDLGDLLVEGFRTFAEHVPLDSPAGVKKIVQYTGASEKLEAFKKRYPAGDFSKKFNKDFYLTAENAFMIDPVVYLDWLTKEALFMKRDHIEIIDDVVKEVSEDERVHLKTLNGRTLSFEKVIFCGGVYNNFWSGINSKTAQGSYLEYSGFDLNEDSFSLTLDGENLVYNNDNKTLLIGSTTEEVLHELGPERELRSIYDSLSQAVKFKLPAFETAKVKVGLREKAKKREPYSIQKNHQFFMGGLYKNGFSLSLSMARNFSHRYL